jgi:CHAD domain-containing protein
MRIAAKGLRYTLEIFAPLYPGELAVYLQVVKSGQELLGDLHDCDVWTTLLPRFIEQERDRVLTFYGHMNPFHPLVPGLAFFQENRAQQRGQKFREFRTAWEQWQANDPWSELHKAVMIPIHRRIYPLPAARLPDEPVGG